MDIYTTSVNQGRLQLNKKLYKSQKIRIAQSCYMDAQSDRQSGDYASQQTLLGICIAYYEDLKMHADVAKCIIYFAMCLLNQDIFEDGLLLLDKAKTMLLEQKEYDMYANCVFAINLNLYKVNRLGEAWVNLKDILPHMLQKCTIVTQRTYYFNLAMVNYDTDKIRDSHYYFIELLRITPNAPENDELLEEVFAYFEKIDILIRMNNY